MRVQRMWILRMGLLVPIWAMGCMSPPDGVGVDEGRLDVAGHLKGPAMMKDLFVQAFGAGNANVAINPTTDGTTAAAAALGTSQSFAAVLQSAPGGFRDRIPFYTAGFYAAKPSTSLAGISPTTAQLQQFICPVSGAFASDIAGVTPTMLVLPDTTDGTDSVLVDLCASRTLRTGAVVIADGPVGRQWNGTIFVSFAVTGFGKPCASGDGQAVCSRKYGQTTGVLALGDSRIQVGSGSIALLPVDGITPSSSTIPSTYPRSRPIHLVDQADTDARVVQFWLWLDGDGTMAHPDHHSAFLGFGTARGFIAGSL